MAVIKLAIAVILIAMVTLVMSPQPVLGASEGSDTGSIEWESGRVYYPSESQARYWISYPAVNIVDITPGASKEFRLTVGNVSEGDLDFNISVESSVASGNSFQALPDDWVVVTTESVSPSEAKKAKAVDLVAVPAGNSAQLWVRVSVPDKKKYKDEDFQGRIRVTEAGDTEGPDSVVTVSTADRMAGQGQKSAPFIFATIIIVLVVGGIAVYLFSRWKWPDEPKEEKENKNKNKKKNQEERVHNTSFAAPNRSHSGGVAGNDVVARRRLEAQGSSSSGHGQASVPSERENKGFSTGLSPDDWK